MPPAPGVNEAWCWEREEPSRGGGLWKVGGLELLLKGRGGGIHRGSGRASSRAQGWREGSSTLITRGPPGNQAAPSQPPGTKAGVTPN